MKKLVLAFALASLFSISSAGAADGFLADRHMARSMKCDACHAPNAPNKVKVDKEGHEACVACHGWYDAVARKTQSADGENPHAQHDGNLPCTECHKGHKPGVNYCAQCHGFTFNVP